MNPKWERLAGELLELAADEFGNHGCNDWRWPDYMTLEERLELSLAMEKHNVNGRELTANEKEDAETRAIGEYGAPDWWIMTFLGSKLRGQ